MRFYKGRFVSDYSNVQEAYSLHALDEATDELYSYVQDLKSWNRDRLLAGHFHFPEQYEEQGHAIFEEVPRDEVYGLLDQVPRLDQRIATQRLLAAKLEAQIKRSGQVLTSAEVGLLTGPLSQRPTAVPYLKEMLEARGQHRRWTTIFLYEEDGATRRKAISTLKANKRLQKNSKGHPLAVRHKTKRYRINGENHNLIAVEAKYLPTKETTTKGDKS